MSTTISYHDVWRFESPTNFNTINVDGLSGHDGIIYLNGKNLMLTLTAISAANYEEIFYLSARLDEVYALFQSMSSEFYNTYTVVNLGSANWDSVYTTFQAISADIPLYNGNDLTLRENLYVTTISSTNILTNTLTATDKIIADTIDLTDARLYTAGVVIAKGNYLTLKVNGKNVAIPLYKYPAGIGEMIVEDDLIVS